jgi:hypothetical protein
VCRNARNGKGDAVARQRISPLLCDSCVRKTLKIDEVRSRRRAHERRACPHRAECFQTVRAFSNVPRSSPGLTASSACYRTHRTKTHAASQDDREETWEFWRVRERSRHGIEGRERYSVNVRYMCDFRSDSDALARVLVPASDG